MTIFKRNIQQVGKTVPAKTVKSKGFSQQVMNVVKSLLNRRRRKYKMLHFVRDKDNVHNDNDNDNDNDIQTRSPVVSMFPRCDHCVYMVWLAMCVLSLLPVSSAFNVEPKSAVVYQGQKGSMFGYALLAEHVTDNKRNTRLQLLIGSLQVQMSPEGQKMFPAVFRCNTTDSDSCQLVPPGEQGTYTKASRDSKHAKWFGPTRGSYDDFGQDSKHRIIMVGRQQWMGFPGNWYWQGRLLYHTASKIGVEENIEKTPAGTWMNVGIYKGISSARLGLENYGNDETNYVVGKPSDEHHFGKVEIYNKDVTKASSLVGEQIGSFFGSSLEIVDLNGDGLEDIIVGAPLYKQFGETITDPGRVYIYYQSEAFQFKSQNRDVLDGTMSGSRFGTTLGHAGDINLDGINDICIGAPYAGKDGRGAIYIYHGSKTGIQSEAAQIIFAKDVAPNLKGFGFSMSCGEDHDGNRYPDMLVGAYASDNAVFLRTRPVIRVYVFLRSQPEVVNLQEKDCSLPDKTTVTCLTIGTCIEYDGHNERQDIDITWVLDAKNNNSQTQERRAFFTRSIYDYSETKTFKLHKRRTLCSSSFGYVKNDPEDKFSPINITVSFKLTEDTLTSDPRRGVLPPVLDAYIPTETSFMVQIQNNCGADNICTPDLQVKCQGISTVYTIGSTEAVEVLVIVVNVGEDAFNTILWMTLPPGVEYKGISMQSSAYIRCEQHRTQPNIVICGLGNPMDELKVTLTPTNTSNIKDQLLFKFYANSSNPEFPSNYENNYDDVAIPVTLTQEENADTGDGIAVKNTTTPQSDEDHIEIDVIEEAPWLGVNKTELEEEIDSVMKETYHCHNNPGVAVSVVKDGELIFSRGYGVLDLDTREPVTDTSLFGIASLSKSFAATLLVKLLYEQTNLTVDSKIVDFLGDKFRMPDDVRTKETTFADILAHRTAVPPNNKIRYNHNLTRENLIEYISKLPAPHQFRVQYFYSNLMYGLATYLAEVIGNSTWEQLITEHLFHPLGMNKSTFATVLNFSRPDVATGYKEEKDASLTPVPHEFSRRWGLLAGSGAIMSTARDMAHWMNFHLYDGVNNEGQQVMSGEHLKEVHKARMVMPESATSNEDIRTPVFPVTSSCSTYAHGFKRGFYRGYEKLTHTGSTLGYRAMLTLLPTEKIGVFTVLSGSDSDKLYRVPLHMYLLDKALGLDSWLNSSTICSFPDAWRPRNKTMSLLYPHANVKPKRKIGEYKGTYFNKAYGHLEISYNTSLSSLMMTFGWGTWQLISNTDPNEDVFYGAGHNVLIDMKIIEFQECANDTQHIVAVKATAFDSFAPPVFTKLGLMKRNTKGKL